LKSKSGVGMIEYDGKLRQFKITILVANEGDVKKYRDGILKILNKVEIDRNDLSLINDLKSVYELLNHLMVNDPQ